MDVDRIQRLLQNRENQLKEMAIQLSEHLKLISKLELENSQLRSENDEMKKKLKKKEELLSQELKNKEILLQKLNDVEKSPEPKLGTLARVKNMITKQKKEEPSAAAPYVDFFSRVQAGTQPPDFKHMPDFTEAQEEVAEPQQPDNIISNEIDITKELERMGLSDLVKKY